MISLNNNGFFLIDREGVKLQEVNSQLSWDFPLFVDSRNFEENIDEKLSLGWTILDSLNPLEREAIAVIDLTEYENAKIKLKESPTWILIGGKGFQKRMKLFRANEPVFKRYGPLEYVDLRFEERIYIKPQHIFANDFSPSYIKEAK